MIDYTREDIIEALEYLVSPVCTETQFDYCDEIRAAIALLKEQEPRVLEYYEIEKNLLVWLEDNNKEDVIPALFLQYNGWTAEFAVQAPDKYVDTIIRSAKVVSDERTYGITWRAWTSRPTPEQMRDTPWEGENETM